MRRWGPAERLPELTRGRIEPLSEARYKIEFTASADLREELELCRDLMSHANPTRDLGVVVERAVTLLLGELEKKRLGRVKRPRSGVPRGAKRGRISAAARRQVFERDGVQCSYVSSDGYRCETRAFLELDHIEPRARGGSDEVTNLRVRCRAHNQLAAAKVFGREHIRHRAHFVRTKCPPGPSENERRDRGAIVSTAPNNAGARKARSAIDLVCSALKRLGFRDNEVRSAVARVASEHVALDDLPLELALREALLAATPDLPRR